MTTNNLDTILDKLMAETHNQVSDDMIRPDQITHFTNFREFQNEAKQAIEAYIAERVLEGRLNEAEVARHRIKHNPVESLLFTQDSRIKELREALKSNERVTSDDATM